jgi:hypothetical protein
MDIPIDINKTGLAFAHADDLEQATFFNTFAFGMKQAMKESNRDTQICYLTDHLDSNGIWLINEIHEYIKLKNEARAGTNVNA